MIKESKFTTTYILGGILFILMITIFLLKDPLGVIKKEEKSPFVEPFEIEEITRIEIDAPEISEKLEKLAQGWKVTTKNSLKADEAIILTLLKKTRELKRGEITSKNKEKHSLFQVDESGVHVKIYSGEAKKADFYVGKTGPQFSSTYVRKEGEDTVYLFKENLIAIFNKKEFRDLAILTFEDDKVKSLTFETEKERLILEKDEKGDWRITQPLRVEIGKDKVQPILNTLSSLKGKDVVTDPDEEKAGFKKPTLQVVISFGETEQKRLLIGSKLNAEEAADYYAKTEDNPALFVISNSLVSTFPTRISDFPEEKN